MSYPLFFQKTSFSCCSYVLSDNVSGFLNKVTFPVTFSCNDFEYLLLSFENDKDQRSCLLKCNSKGKKEKKTVQKNMLADMPKVYIQLVFPQAV